MKSFFETFEMHKILIKFCNDTNLILVLVLVLFKEKLFNCLQAGDTPQLALGWMQ